MFSFNVGFGNPAWYVEYRNQTGSLPACASIHFSNAISGCSGSYAQGTAEFAHCVRGLIFRAFGAPWAADTYAFYGVPFLMTPQCEFVGLATATMQSVCSSAGFYTNLSPISFLMKEGEDIHSKGSIVQFPVDPRHAPKWVLWRGSETTPLLVYDPQHTGKIVGGDQLFGNWSFGGYDGLPWSDGYEALRTLDKNADGLLSGTELDSMALWFDRNSDAISQPGEVQPLSEVGVTEVYLEVTRRDPDTRSLFAEAGFTRVVNGKAQKGVSVDWYVATAESQADLVRQMVRYSSATTTDHPQNRAEKSTSATSTTDKQLAGLWTWRGSSGTLPPELRDAEGYLIFSETKNGKFSGLSIAPQLFTGKRNPPFHLMKMVDIKGQAVAPKPNMMIWKFSYDPQSTEDKNVQLESTVSFAPDGKSLMGLTQVHGKNRDGSDFNVTYSWIAERASPG